MFKDFAPAAIEILNLPHHVIKKLHAAQSYFEITELK
jgi:hypothetical protein